MTTRYQGDQGIVFFAVGSNASTTTYTDVKGQPRTAQALTDANWLKSDEFAAGRTLEVVGMLAGKLTAASALVRFEVEYVDPDNANIFNWASVAVERGDKPGMAAIEHTIAPGDLDGVFDPATNQDIAFLTENQRLTGKVRFLVQLSAPPAGTDRIVIAAVI